MKTYFATGQPLYGCQGGSRFLFWRLPKPHGGNELPTRWGSSEFKQADATTSGMQQQQSQ